MSRALSARGWAPLRRAAFRSLLGVGLLANLGALMQSVASTWLLLGLTSSATLVALLQTASAAPVFLLVLVAGALADIVDRRQLLRFSVASMALVSLTMAVVTRGPGGADTDPVARLCARPRLGARHAGQWGPGPRGRRRR